MITYGVFNPQNYTIGPITLYNQVDKTIKFLRLLNNSPYQLAVSLDGQIANISEFWQKDIPIPPYFQGNLTILPSVGILTILHAQAYLLTVMGLTDQDGGGGLDAPINQQAVNPTASGNPSFTALFGTGGSAGPEQTLNIFNPANSGVDMVFHSARGMSNSANLPNLVLLYEAGLDLNLTKAVTPGSHLCSANPPVSQAHCTAADDAGHRGLAINIENERLPGNQETLELLVFPDTIILKQGCNLLLVCADSITGKTVQLALKWTEINSTN